MLPGTSSRSKKQCTGAQLALLAKFMSTDPQFANMQYNTFCEYQEMWEQLKDELKEFGPDKTVKQWKQTWRDLKRMARQANLETLRANTTYQLVLDVMKQESLSSSATEPSKYLTIISKLDAASENVSDESLDASSDPDTIEFKCPRKRITKVQFTQLVGMMSLDPMFANGQLAHHDMNRKWEQLKHKLKVYGPDKTVEQWKQTWRDLKNKVRQTNLTNTPMSETDEKIVEILNQQVEYSSDTNPDASGLSIEAVVVANNESVDAASDNSVTAAMHDDDDELGASPDADPFASPPLSNTEFDAIFVKIEQDLVEVSGEPLGAASDKSATAPMHTDDEQSASSEDDSEPSRLVITDALLNMKKEQNALLNKICRLLEEQNHLLKRQMNPVQRRVSKFRRRR